jgi:hypothetical protein
MPATVMAMTLTSPIKMITEDELTKAVADKSRRRTRRRTGTASLVSDFLELVRAEARPVDERLREPSATETSILLIIDESQAMSVVDLFAALTRTVEDRRRFGELVDVLTPTEDVTSSPVLEQARRNAAARQSFLSEFPSLSSGEVAELYGSTAKNRAALAQNWRKQGRVFGVPTPSGQRFPLFQFTADGQPKPAIAEVLSALSAGGLDGWQLALWFTGSLASLGDRRPVDVLDEDPVSVIEAARRVGEVPQ